MSSVDNSNLDITTVVDIRDFAPPQQPERRRSVCETVRAAVSPLFSLKARWRNGRRGRGIAKAEIHPSDEKPKREGVDTDAFLQTLKSIQKGKKDRDLIAFFKALPGHLQEELLLVGTEEEQAELIRVWLKGVPGDLEPVTPRDLNFSNLENLPEEVCYFPGLQGFDLFHAKLLERYKASPSLKRLINPAYLDEKNPKETVRQAQRNVGYLLAKSNLKMHPTLDVGLLEQAIQDRSVVLLFRCLPNNLKEKLNLEGMVDQQADQIRNWMRTHRAELSKLEELDLKRLDLFVIPEEIKHFSNLKKIDLECNSIADIAPLSSLENLQVLGLGRNPIADLTPLSRLANLKTLMLYQNQITNLAPLSGLTNLERLELDLNRIADLTPLSRLVKLRDLSLKSNQITDLTPLSSLVKLNQLYLNNNQIANLTPLSSLVNLTQLHLSSNEIADLTPLSLLVDLICLHLNDNQITDLTPLSRLVKLWGLWLAENQIANLTPLSSLVNLMQLHLSSNEIADLTPLSSLVKLMHLDLSSNQIADLTPLNLLENLVWLHLENNQIADIAVINSLQRLIEVGLSGNPVEEVWDLDESPSLVEIREWIARQQRIAALEATRRAYPAALEALIQQGAPPAA